MKAKTLLRILSLALAGITAGSADELIIMTFNGDSADAVKNLGTLPDGIIGSDNRPKPARVSPGIGDAGHAIKFTNEQTGRPDYYQSVEISSDGMDNLSTFTITMWFKSDSTAFNPKNPIGDRLTTILLDTTAAVGGNEPGIKIGLNTGAVGEQLFVYLSDGTTSARQWLSFTPRPDTRDGQWTFVAITFDGAAEKRRLKYYGGDEIIPTKQLAAAFDFDKVTSTGNSSKDVISIGDGNNGFANTSSHIGLIDGIYITDYVMDEEQIEAIRKASLK